METINDYMPLSNDWNNERLQTLKKLYPDLFTNEQMPNLQELIKIFNYAGIQETERFEFRWFGKSQAKRNAFTPSNATLVYDDARSVNPNDSENIIIEGENLEVLKLLSGSYREKIKCIYIDPPYNTGKDFVYSDNFTQDKRGYWEDAEVLENGVKIDTNTETDGRYHSNWLNMMYSRLLIARQLLREDGVIFISIDENEVHHLRKLCEDVFGEDNYAGEIVWKNSSKNDQSYISIQHEYILCFVKNKDENKGLWQEKKEGLEEIYKAFNNFYLKHGKNWKEIHKEAVLWYKQFNESNPISSNKHYSWMDEKGIYFPDNISGPNYGQYRYDVIHPITGKVCKEPSSGWRFPEETMKQRIKDNLVHFGKDEITVPNNKTYLNNTEFQSLTSVKYRDGRVASKKLITLFEANIFTNPKDFEVLNQLFRAVNIKENDLILDFFAGSGTIGQAIMELNKEDGGNRKFILVQIPEATDEKSEAYKAGYKKISDITIERNKRVIAKIAKELVEQKKKKGQELPFGMVAEPVNAEYQTTNVKSKTGLGFKVFKLQKSNFPRVDFAPDPELDDVANLELLKKYIADKESQLVNAFNKEELLTEILIKNNFTLNYTTIPQEQFTKNEIVLVRDSSSLSFVEGWGEAKETLICLDVFIAPETVDYFKANTNQKFICLERALDTTKKYNLKHYLGDKFNAF
jgi:adenine-specific DNA-methyltransferase